MRLFKLNNRLERIELGDYNLNSKSNRIEREIGRSEWSSKLNSKSDRLERIESELDEVGRSEWIRRLRKRGRDKLFEKRAVNVSANSIGKVIGLGGDDDFVKSIKGNLERVKSHNARVR